MGTVVRPAGGLRPHTRERALGRGSRGWVTPAAVGWGLPPRVGLPRERSRRWQGRPGCIGRLFGGGGEEGVRWRSVCTGDQGSARGFGTSGDALWGRPHSLAGVLWAAPLRTEKPPELHLTSDIFSLGQNNTGACFKQKILGLPDPGFEPSPSSFQLCGLSASVSPSVQADRFPLEVRLHLISSCICGFHPSLLSAGPSFVESAEGDRSSNRQQLLTEKLGNS